MLFVKYLSDTYTENLNDLKDKYNDEARLERAKSRLPFVLQEEQTFDYLYDNRYDSEIGQKINAALRAIEDNNAQLQGVFRSVDFNSEANLGNSKQKATTLRNLLEDFKPLDLRPSMIEVKENQVASDVLGDAFEYMIGEFASQAGKKAGSFFTPMMVSELMAQIAKPKSGDSIYDPTSGSSSLLIRAAKYAGVKQVAIYGQEMNGSSWSMGKMNMFIHDIMDAKLAWGDTLANPAHLDSDGNLMKFNVVVANMPFSQDKWAEGFNPGGENDGNNKNKDKKFKMEAKLDPYNRFDWGVPPSSKGDWAFLLHMINSLQPDGRMVAVVPHVHVFGLSNTYLSPSGATQPTIFGSPKQTTVNSSLSFSNQSFSFFNLYFLPISIIVCSFQATLFIALSMRNIKYMYLKAYHLDIIIFERDLNGF